MIYTILAPYYGMNRDEFIALINGDIDKLHRFIEDYLYNHN
jgi:hypothetical protein